LPGAPKQPEQTKEKKKTRNPEKISPALTSGKKDRKTIQRMIFCKVVDLYLITVK
jgi:hypothetical protein